MHAGLLALRVLPRIRDVPLRRCASVPLRQYADVPMHKSAVRSL